MRKFNLLILAIITLLILACTSDNKAPSKTNSNHTLLVIDMQNDFCNGGSLQVGKNPNAIIPYVNKLIKSDKFEKIVFSQDWHPKEHKSFASNHKGKKVYEIIKLNGIDQVLWPDHCIQNDSGAAFHKDVLFKDSFKVIKKGKNIEVDSYSAFRDNSKNEKTELDKYLKDNNILEVTVVGLALDYCVKFTCIDAIENGYKVNLHLKGTEAVNTNPKDGENTIKKLKDIGVNVIE